MEVELGERLSANALSVEHLPHEFSSAIIQHLIATNKYKSALPILLLGFKYYQQQHQPFNKCYQLCLLLSNNHQAQLTLEQSNQLIQASSSIQNLMQDIEGIQSNTVQAEEIPLPLLTNNQVNALLPYISIINALNTSDNTLPLVQQNIPEVTGLSYYWVKYAAPQHIKEYLTACTIPALCDLLITASYLDIQSAQRAISFIQLATQAVADKLIQLPQYQEQYSVINTLPPAIQPMLVQCLIHNSPILKVLCRDKSDEDTILLILPNYVSNTGSTLWSPDRKYIANSFKDSTVKTWDANTGDYMHTLEGHSDKVTSISWSPDSKYIASGSYDNTIRVWDASIGNCIYTLKGHTGKIHSVSWSPDGKYIASGSDDKTVRVWNTVTSSSIYILDSHTSIVNSVTWSPDSKYLASCSNDKTVKIWDITNGICIRTLTSNNTGSIYSINSIAWSPDGSMIASITSGSLGNTINIWDTDTGNCIHILKDDDIDYVIPSVSWLLNSKHIVSSSEHTVKVWDVTTEAQLHCLRDYADSFNSVSWYSNDNQLVTCSNNGKIKVWNRIDNKLINYLQSTLSWEQALLLIRIINAYKTNQDTEFIFNILTLPCYNTLDQKVKQLVDPLLKRVIVKKMEKIQNSYLTIKNKNK